MSVVPVICGNQQCHNLQGDGQRAQWKLILGEIAVVGSDRRVEGDYFQEVNGGQRKQEGLAINIMHRTDFIDGQRSVEEEFMAYLWTDKYINKFAYRSPVQPRYNRNILLHNHIVNCLHKRHSHLRVHRELFAEKYFKSAVNFPWLGFGVTHSNARF